MIEEHDPVVLLRDVPEHGLLEGDVGTVVHRYADGRAYEVEFVRAAGETLALVSLDASEVRRPDGGEILHVRKLSTV